MIDRHRRAQRGRAVFRRASTTCCASDYPADRRQIIVVSDGFHRRHARRPRAATATRSTLIAVPAGGKALALNAGVRGGAAELVFADARQRFAPDALRELVAPFADPPGRRGHRRAAARLRVGAARTAGGRRPPPRAWRSAACQRPRTAAADRPPAGASSTIGDGVGIYWHYEKALRRLESLRRLDARRDRRHLRHAPRALAAAPGRHAARRCAGADAGRAGGLPRGVRATRRSAFDRAAENADGEARRKVADAGRQLPDPVARAAPAAAVCVNPVWLQYVSHKVGRLLVPYALAGRAVGQRRPCRIEPLSIRLLLAHRSRSSLAATAPCSSCGPGGRRWRRGGQLVRDAADQEQATRERRLVRQGPT